MDDEDEVLTVYYDANTNSFRDDWGITVYDISNIMSNENIMLYKKAGGTFYCCDSEGLIYQVEFPTSISVDRTIVYYEDDNTMTDEEDEMMFNIFSIITPNDLLLFKKNRKSICIEGTQGGKINLVYLEKREE